MLVTGPEVRRRMASATLKKNQQVSNHSYYPVIEQTETAYNEGWSFRESAKETTWLSDEGPGCLTEPLESTTGGTWG